MLRRPATVLLLGLAAACDPGAEDPSDTAGSPEADATCDPAGARRGSPEGAPKLRIGTNTPGETVESFIEAAEGADVAVIPGVSWGQMVAVAAATDAFPSCVERINIVASIRSRDDTKIFGELKFRRRPFFFFEGPDEMRYLLNVWLPIGDPRDWEDREATMTVELEPYGGGEIIKKSVNIVLRRQTD